MNSGKSLYMTYKGINDYIQGRKIYTNLNLLIPHVKVTRETILKFGKTQPQLNNISFLLDEFWIWFDSRSSNENKMATNFLLQSSKQDTNIYMTAQDNSQNDKRIRQNQHFITICDRRILQNGKLKRIKTERRILPSQYWSKLYILAKTYKYQLLGIERGIKLISKETIKAETMFKLYDTHQKIKK